jgi:hypothetical protein
MPFQGNATHRTRRSPMDIKDAALLSICMRDQWSITTIVAYLKTSRTRVYAALEQIGIHLMTATQNQPETRISPGSPDSYSAAARVQ